VDNGSIPVEHQEDMHAFAQGDKELDAQRDIIGNQLTDVVNLAETIGTQTKSQGQQLRSGPHVSILSIFDEENIGICDLFKHRPIYLLTHQRNRSEFEG